MEEEERIRARNAENRGAGTGGGNKPPFPPEGSAGGPSPNGSAGAASRASSGTNGLKRTLERAGGFAKKVPKWIPYLGTGAGIASIGMNLKEGNIGSAALDAFGTFVPGYGDFADFTRMSLDYAPEGKYKYFLSPMLLLEKIKI